MKRIILPTDFSSNARNAMEYAIGMYSYENVEYILLNVFTEPHSSTDMLVSVRDLLEKTSFLGLKNEYEKLNKKFYRSSLNIKQHSECGELSNIINRIVKEEAIDFVVMGTKGASGLQKVFLGSNTSDVVKNVKCPVLAIPENAEFTPPFRIALATDYEELENQYLLNPLIELASQYQSELMIMNINTEGKMIDVKHAVEGIQLDHALERIPHRFYGSDNDDVVEGIDYFIHEHKIDMLAMIARKHHFYEHLFHSSVTEEMAMLTDIPLLILHED
jgi:nucleotide-binding universal stress UspA family protein